MDSNAAIPPAYAAPQPVQQPKSRKKMWVIVILSVLLLIFLLIVGCCTALYFGVTHALKSTQVYVLSIQRAQASPCATSKLGTPLTANGVPQGSANENNDSGSADLTIPIKGPQGTGSVHVIASRENKIWTLTSETLTVAGTDYDLPATPSPCDAAAQPTTP
jgi:hypothetical protein